MSEQLLDSPSTTASSTSLFERRDIMSETDEPFAALYLRLKALQREGRDHTLPLFGFLSCRAGEGVSTFAGSVAAAAAASGERRVLLVDANGAKPDIGRLFHCDGDPGFADHLQASAGAVAAFGRPSEALPNLSVLGFGRPFTGPAAVFESHRLPTFLKLLPLHFSFVVFDLASLQNTKAAVRLAALLTGVVLVVEAERTRWQAAKQSLTYLQSAGVNVVGAVLNKRRQYVPDWLYRRL